VPSGALELDEDLREELYWELEDERYWKKKEELLAAWKIEYEVVNFLELAANQ